MDISETIDRSVGTAFNQWLVAHPYLAWIVAHPLASAGLLLLTIFSLWGLFKAIGRGIEQTWVFLLTTPFKLLQPIFGLLWRSIRRVFGHTNASVDRVESQLVSDSPAERIATIVDRLQSLTQEQELLLQELATLTASTAVTPNMTIISDTQYKDMYAKLPKST
ncbi:hypothetical protein [Chamaesiphon polymorphus]|uniref:Uncharacterized protein n=1 Tax=Chamaesiphon polymorphus CCALA 037 TaxID=2107692 RepID=A0A2T1GDA8_9CYAN|nr:hypothetical protein [Chamaesiphon polymorphus]PSB55447.1 hypothetical protein C7B77_14985 [Chamaesiphon polymorphus CCALA 037]